LTPATVYGLGARSGSPHGLRANTAKPDEPEG
jgi:hypothetical protein